MNTPDNLLGESEIFLSCIDHVSRIAAIHRPVLILGERGTGKELIAKRIHYLSSRWNKILLSLNCSALSEGLIDSELFGHESGAFSGAKARHKGRFERAEGGTLFLDEIATAPIPVQEKLLRVIEYNEFERVGGNEALSANVRLICATNQDLKAMVEQGMFRADLLDRLTFDIIHLPPLRERREDILILAEHFAQKMCTELGFQQFYGFTSEIMSALLNYHWPGNIRELKNVVERAVYRFGKEDKPLSQIMIDPFQAPWKYPAPPASSVKNSLLNKPQHQFELPMNLRQWQQEQEKEIVIKALSQAKFSQARAAELLGLSYHQIRGLMKKYQLTGD